MLQNLEKSNELIIALEYLPGMFLQAQFGFNQAKQAADVLDWAVTDSAGRDFMLSYLKYEQFGDVVLEIFELIDAHLRHYSSLIEERHFLRKEA
jgi:hypothetical protein